MPPTTPPSSPTASNPQPGAGACTDHVPGRPARGRGVPVVLIVYPTLDLLEGRVNDDLGARLAALGSELGWQVIDVTMALKDGPADLFVPDDPVHLNAAGYERAAAHAARELLARRWLP